MPAAGVAAAGVAAAGVGATDERGAGGLTAWPGPLKEPPLTGRVLALGAAEPGRLECPACSSSSACTVQLAASMLLNGAGLQLMLSSAGSGAAEGRSR